GAHRDGRAAASAQGGGAARDRAGGLLPRLRPAGPCEGRIRRGGDDPRLRARLHLLQTFEKVRSGHIRRLRLLQPGAGWFENRKRADRLRWHGRSAETRPRGRGGAGGASLHARHLRGGAARLRGGLRPHRRHARLGRLPARDGREHAASPFSRTHRRAGERLGGGAMSVAKPLPHDSAHLHVAGTARYVDDLPLPANTLHLAFGLSTLAHGEILSVDLTEVRASPGVVAVWTAADLPFANDVSPSIHDEPLLATDRVRYVGQ